MMSPRLTSVAAAGPSSAPVRREYVATSGIARRIASILRAAASVSVERGARGQEVVEDERALVHLGQKTGGDEPRARARPPPAAPSADGQPDQRRRSIGDRARVGPRVPGRRRRRRGGARIQRARPAGRRSARRPATAAPRRDSVTASAAKNRPTTPSQPARAAGTRPRSWRSCRPARPAGRARRRARRPRRGWPSSSRRRMRLDHDDRVVDDEADGDRRPPSDIRFRLWPSSPSGTKVIPSVSGTAIAATSPAADRAGTAR